MAGNYPAGVTDSNDHFNSDPDGTKRRMSEPQPRPVDYGPDHDPDCKCEECECPY